LAQRVDLPEDRLSCTGLDGSDPARAVIDPAGANGVDPIVMGARAFHDAALPGAVSSRVVAEAS
jgi:hypothetical protein